MIYPVDSAIQCLNNCTQVDNSIHWTFVDHYLVDKCGKALFSYPVENVLCSVQCCPHFGPLGNGYMLANSLQSAAICLYDKCWSLAFAGLLTLVILQHFHSSRAMAAINQDLRGIGKWCAKILYS